LGFNWERELEKKNNEEEEGKKEDKSLYMACWKSMSLENDDCRVKLASRGA
jgi:hypothetical protein